MSEGNVEYIPRDASSPRTQGVISGAEPNSPPLEMYATVACPASSPRIWSSSRPPKTGGRTLGHMATPFLIALVYVAVVAAVLYLVVRFGVRDGMTDFENRRGDRDLRR